MVVSAAGGQWIDVPQTEFHTHDGSHLRDDAARELSTYIARKIEAGDFMTR